ncbi:MAG: hypothetical protein V4592_18265 [Bacteroidota bacterium]
MDIAVKNKIVEKILQSDDDLLLNEVEALIGLSDRDFGLDLPIEVKTAIKLAKKQLKEGQGIPHQQMMDEVKKRFLKR